VADRRPSFLALNVVALTTATPELARSMYAAMNVIGLYVIVPASLLTLVTGIVQGVYTQWGLLQHRWVVTKLVLGVLATIALLLHQFTAVRTAAHRAADGMDPRSLGVQLVADASVAIVLLVVATVLSVVKPWGLTRYGQRKRDDTAKPTGLTRSAKVSVAIAIAVVAAFAVIHLATGGMHH
jgi:uncharacterized membrane protein